MYDYRCKIYLHESFWYVLDGVLSENLKKVVNKGVLRYFCVAYLYFRFVCYLNAGKK